MDLSVLALNGSALELAAGILSIVLIDLILAGDNAVVIAMAVRSLPPRQRRQGIILGSAAAVVLRIGLTFFAAQMLDIPFLKLAGGVLIAWIAVKLFVDACPTDNAHRECAGIWDAVKTIIVADLVMSVDNVLAVAGASKGSLGLLIFGLGLSIPFVVFTSGLLSRLMDRFPWFIYLGAAVLGKVAGEMVLSDPWVHAHLSPSPLMTVATEVGAAMGVILIGRLLVGGSTSCDQPSATMPPCDAPGAENRQAPAQESPQAPRNDV